MKDLETPAAVDGADLTERTLQGLHGHLISRLPAISSDAPVLDVGCGTGAWLKRLSVAGFTNLWGIDRNLSALGFTGAKTEVTDLDADVLPFSGQRFELITAIEVVEHLENPGRLYRLFSALLSDTGIALVTTPNIHSLVSRLRHLVKGKLGQFDEKGDPTHVAPLLLDGVARILTRYELAVSARWGYPEKGSVIHRRPFLLAAQILATVLPDTVPGDTLCMVIRRTAPRSTGPALAGR